MINNTEIPGLLNFFDGSVTPLQETLPFYKFPYIGVINNTEI